MGFEELVFLYVTSPAVPTATDCSLWPSSPVTASVGWPSGPSPSTNVIQISVAVKTAIVDKNKNRAPSTTTTNLDAERSCGFRYHTRIRAAAVIVLGVQRHFATALEPAPTAAPAERRRRSSRHVPYGSSLFNCLRRTWPAPATRETQHLPQAKLMVTPQRIRIRLRKRISSPRFGFLSPGFSCRTTRRFALVASSPCRLFALSPLRRSLAGGQLPPLPVLYPKGGLGSFQRKKRLPRPCAIIVIMLRMMPAAVSGKKFHPLPVLYPKGGLGSFQRKMHSSAVVPTRLGHECFRVSQDLP